MPLPTKDLCEQRFGRLRVLERIRWGYVSPGGQKSTAYRCICDCGREVVVRGLLLGAGKTTSCGCYHKERAKLSRRLRPYEYLFNLLKKAADRRKHDFDLLYEEFACFTSQDSCHYCSAPIIWQPHASNDSRRIKGYGHHLDRKDNSKGYSADNCVVCCRRCNWGKGDQFSYEEWKQIGELIKTFPATGTILTRV